MNPLQWLRNDKLLFPLSVNERTGETLQQTRVAKYNGLLLKITPSRKYPGTNHCQIEGSIHKFHNEGRHNANDFHLSEVSGIVKILQDQFGVSEDSKLSNLEFGVNITLPIPVKRFLKMVVSMPDRRFCELDLEKMRVGKVCAKEDHHFKLYDKGLLTHSTKNNLLRVELSVKKMRILKPYGIETLQDLTNVNKVTGLGLYLARIFSEVIIIDPSIYKNPLSVRQRNKLKDYDNPRFWEGLTKGQRYKQKRKYEMLLASINGLQIQNTLTNLIIQKWNDLVNEQQKRGDLFTRSEDVKQHLKRVTFSPLEYRVKKYPFTILGNDITQDKEKKGEMILKFAGQKVCLTCGRDITNQRTGSLYCSERVYGKEGKSCRNKASGIKRREKCKKQREKESKLLYQLRQQKVRESHNFCRLTDSAGIEIESQVNRLIMGPDQIKAIKRISLSGSTSPIILTTLRAKGFIKYITGLNLTAKSKNHESVTG